MRSAGGFAMLSSGYDTNSKLLPFLSEALPRQLKQSSVAVGRVAVYLTSLWGRRE